MKGCQHLILFKNSDLLNLKLFNSQDPNDKTIATVDIKQILLSLRFFNSLYIKPGDESIE